MINNEPRAADDDDKRDNALSVLAGLVDDFQSYNLVRAMLDSLERNDVCATTEPRAGYCAECQIPEHDVCGMVEGCPCCDTGNGEESVFTAPTEPRADIQVCADEGKHLKSVDSDGYCNNCGYQDAVPTNPPARTATLAEDYAASLFADIDRLPTDTNGEYVTEQDFAAVIQQAIDESERERVNSHDKLVAALRRIAGAGSEWVADFDSIVRIARAALANEPEGE